MVSYAEARATFARLLREEALTEEEHTGVVAALAGLCYAELASTVPIAGSAYTYTYSVMGEFLAWTVGWALIMEYAIAAAAQSSESRP